MEKNSLYKIVGLIYMIKRLFLMLTIISLSSLVGSLSAQTMDEALGDAVSQLRDGGIGEGESVEMVIEMANYHSKKFDREARVIQGGLYTALQAQFPKAKILLQGESITGVSLKVMVIRGTYKPEGERTYISLKAVNKMNGRMIAKADASYYTERKKFENLVVVMPIEAPHLPKPVVMTLSNVLRSSLSKTGKFNMVSADMIDSVDAEDIQEQYQCSREECSAIVAQQLNANQVITTKYSKLAAGLFFLTASLKDIKTGRTLKEEAIQHDGDIKTLPEKIQEMANKLAGVSSQPAVAAPKPAPRIAPSGQTGLIVLKSTPSEAKIMLDGRLLQEKTDTLLQNIPIGKHEITVYKGKLGATRSIILVPGKAEELHLDLEPLQAELQITSTPQADVFFNGNMKGRTPLVIRTGVGGHKISLRETNYQNFEKSILVKPFIRNQFSARLTALPTLQINSSPEGAAVYLNGDNVGRTPLTLRKPSGQYEIKVESEGYVSYVDTVDVKPFIRNRVDADLKKLVKLILTVSPAAATVEVDGEFLGGGNEITWENRNDVIELEKILSEEKHTVKVTHGEALKPEEIEVELTSDMDDHHEKIVLTLNQTYLDQLKYKADFARYESELSSWRWKWIGSLAGSVLGAGYAWQQNAIAKTARAEMETEIDAILPSASYEEARNHEANAEEQNNKIKQSNISSQNGAVLSAALLDLAVWIWLDEPNAPSAVSMMDQLRTKSPAVELDLVLSGDSQAGLALKLTW